MHKAKIVASPMPTAVARLLGKGLLREEFIASRSVISYHLVRMRKLLRPISISISIAMTNARVLRCVAHSRHVVELAGIDNRNSEFDRSAVKGEGYTLNAQHRHAC